MLTHCHHKVHHRIYASESIVDTIFSTLEKPSTKIKFITVSERGRIMFTNCSEKFIFLHFTIHPTEYVTNFQKIHFLLCIRRIMLTDFRKNSFSYTSSFIRRNLLTIFSSSGGSPGRCSDFTPVLGPGARTEFGR